MRQASDFVSLLNLTKAEHNLVTLSTVMGRVYDVSRVIWSGPVLYEFVDHGIDHSYRALELAIDIFRTFARPEEQMSLLERAVLGAAALIHDIGMQYNKYRLGRPELAPQEVRATHAELGHEMTTRMLDEKLHLDSSEPPLRLTDPELQVLGYSKLVAFAHSDRNRWDHLRDLMYAELMDGGALLRLKLLAALLRLGDELHCDHTRVHEQQWLRVGPLDDRERAHWSACYYTQAVALKAPPGRSGLRIALKWRIPSGDASEEVELIRALLQDLRERKFNEEIALAKDYLKLEEGAEPYMLEFNLDPNPISVMGVAPLHEGVGQYVRQVLRPVEYRVRPPAKPENVAELKGTGPIEAVKYRVDEFLRRGGVGVRSGHFRLRTGWHTNKYVSCRELCSDAGFVADLSLELAKAYKGYRLTEIVAVGTSAIPIASMLAFLLNARLTYTFRAGRGDDTDMLARGYTDYEEELTPSESGNVLIIDDILGVGSVIGGVIDSLRKRPKPPEHIRVLTIYSLGDVKELAGDLEGVKVDYLASFPDVRYEKEDPKTKTCSECKDRPEIVIPEE